MGYSNVYNRVWVPARDEAGIPSDEYGAFHRFRKTLGTLVHGQADKTARQATDWRGHGDPAFSARVYTGQMDDGLGKADFLDEVIPVEKWALDRQRASREQPEKDAQPNRADEGSRPSRPIA